MATTLTGTYTGARANGQASVKITIGGRVREIVGNSQYAADNQLQDPVGAAVLTEALAGGTSEGHTMSEADNDALAFPSESSPPAAEPVVENIAGVQADQAPAVHDVDMQDHLELMAVLGQSVSGAGLSSPDVWPRPRGCPSLRETESSMGSRMGSMGKSECRQLRLSHSGARCR
jgi:hypothetical protein